MPAKRSGKLKQQLPQPHPALSALILQNATDAILATGPDLLLTFWNPGAERLYGWTAAEVIGRHVHDVLRSELSESERSKLIAEMDGGSPQPTRARQYRKDGTPIDVEGIGIPLRDSSGGIVGYASVNREISERLASERALVESRARLHAVFQSNPIPTVIYRKTPAGFVFADYNEATLQFTEGRAADYINQPLDDIQRARPDFIEHVHRCFDEKQTLQLQTHYHVITTEQDKHITFTFAYLPPDSVLVHTEDVTELLRAERERVAEMEAQRVREEKEKAQQRIVDIVESISDGFIAVDREWHITYVNRRAADNLGCNPQDLLQRDLWETLPLLRGTAIEKNYREVMETRVPAHFETPGTLHQQWYAVSVYPSPEGITAYSVDITDRKRGEEALRASEDKYRSLFENMTEEVHFWKLVRDSEGQILTWRLVDANPPTLKTWGKARAEILGKTTDEIFGPGATEHYMPVVLKIMREGVPYSYEDYFPNLDKHFRFTSVPFGEFFVTTGADITGIKKAQEAVEQARQRLQNVLDSITDGLAVVDKDWRFTYFNEQGARMIHMRSQDLIGSNLWDLFPYALKSKFSESYYRAVETGRPEHFEEYYPAPLETWFDVHCYPSADGLSIYFRDITERKRAGDALQAAHRRTTEILESIDDGFFSLDHVWCFTYINTRAAANIGQTPDELIGQNIWEAFPRIAGTLHETYYRQTMDDRIPALFEIRDDSIGVSFEVRVYPSADGISVYWIDITARKDAEEERERLHQNLERRAVELEASNKELEAFTYAISHDLRGPLNLVEQFTRLLQDEYGDQIPEHGRHLLQLIRENSGVVDRLAEDLLTLTRMQNQAVARRVISMSDLARQVVDELLPVADRTVEVSIGDLPPASADPLLLKQVWMNLIANALKFTRPCSQGRIEIGSFDELGRAVYFVKDNGVGFSMAYADRLFRAFQRLHHPEDFEGNGLGLAIVERVIRRHGGRVWAQAEVDKGATFFFTLG